MNLRSISLIALIGSVILFASQIRRISKLETEAEILIAEYNSQTSWGNLGSSAIRALFDGATLGTFASEGVFTESKAWERRQTDFAKRQAELVGSYNSALSLRKWAIFLAIGSTATLAFSSYKKSHAAPVSPVSAELSNQ